MHHHTDGPNTSKPTIAPMIETVHSRSRISETSIPFSEFRDLEASALDGIVTSIKDRMGPSLKILGHHYQQDEVIRHADLTGDSLKLSQLAGQDQACRAIVFCGVHFMAETADILSRPEVAVYLPDRAAGCSMADMADLDSVETAWSELAVHLDVDQITPVTYINSSAALKSFCGRHGGIVCTSSNARRVLDWAFSRRPRVLFFPDQHLGRNTARAMGVPLESMALWDPHQAMGGNDPATLHDRRVLLWKGHCSVHQMFKPSHLDQFRRLYPDGKVLVHPECMMEVVDAADLVGSTESIIQTIEHAPAGSSWGIGTELHLVNRLASRHPDKTIHFLSPMVCMCATMYRIDPPHLAWCLVNLERGSPVNRIQVDPETANWAKVALDRMLELR